jgi:hypothetical protein
MAKEGTGKIFKQGKAKTRFVSIPAEVANDSSFPFKDGEKVKAIIKGKKIVFEKL